MNAIITWNDADKNILIVKVSHNWNLDDLKPTALAVREQISSVKHDVDLIIDTRNLHFRQTNMLSHFIDLDRHRLHNRRYAVVIGLNPYLQTLLRVAEIFAPKSLSDLFFANNYGEAAKIIKHRLIEPLTV